MEEKKKCCPLKKIFGDEFGIIGVILGVCFVGMIGIGVAYSYTPTATEIFCDKLTTKAVKYSYDGKTSMVVTADELELKNVDHQHYLKKGDVDKKLSEIATCLAPKGLTLDTTVSKAVGMFYVLWDESLNRAYWYGGNNDSY